MPRNKIIHARLFALASDFCAMAKKPPFPPNIFYCPTVILGAFRVGLGHDYNHETLPNLIGMIQIAIVREMKVSGRGFRGGVRKKVG